MGILDTLKRPWVFNLILSCLFSHLPQSVCVPLFTSLWVCFFLFLLPSYQVSGPLVLSMLVFILSQCSPPPHPTPCLLVHVFPLFGSGISSPGLTSQVCLLHCWLAVSPFVAYLFHNPSQFLYLILYTCTFPTHPLWFQGRPFVKLLEIVSTAYFIGFPQYSRCTKVYSGDRECPKLRWRKDRGKRLTQTRTRGKKSKWVSKKLVCQRLVDPFRNWLECQ